MLVGRPLLGWGQVCIESLSSHHCSCFPVTRVSAHHEFFWRNFRNESPKRNSRIRLIGRSRNSWGIEHLFQRWSPVIYILIKRDKNDSWSAARNGEKLALLMLIGIGDSSNFLVSDQMLLPTHNVCFVQIFHALTAYLIWFSMHSLSPVLAMMYYCLIVRKYSVILPIQRYILREDIALSNF